MGLTRLLIFTIQFESLLEYVANIFISKFLSLVISRGRGPGRVTWELPQQACDGKAPQGCPLPGLSLPSCRVRDGARHGGSQGPRDWRRGVGAGPRWDWKGREDLRVDGGSEWRERWGQHARVLQYPTVAQSHPDLVN